MYAFSFFNHFQERFQVDALLMKTFSVFSVDGRPKRIEMKCFQTKAR